MKGFFLSLLGRWGKATSHLLTIFTTAVVTKYVDSDDLGWLQAIWAVVASLFVSLYNGFLSSVPVPVWLLLLVVGLALIPIWQIGRRVRLTPATSALNRSQTMVLGAIQMMDEVRKYHATLESISEHTTLSPLEAEAALDYLESINFVSRSWPINGPSGYTVLPDGRAYLLERVIPAA